MRRARLALVLLGSLVSPFASQGAAQGFKLNGPLARPATGDVAAYQVSPDGSRVVYSERSRNVDRQLWAFHKVLSPLASSR